jgi:hypothetical protein
MNNLWIAIIMEAEEKENKKDAMIEPVFYGDCKKC